METEALAIVDEASQAVSVLSWDLLLFGGILLILFGYMYTLGKEFVVPATFAAYIVAFLMVFLPVMDQAVAMIEAEQWLARMIVFGASYIAVFFLLKTNGFFEPYVVPTGMEIGTFVVALSGLLFVVLGSYFPAEVVETFSPWTNTLFYQEPARSIWACAPLIAVLLIRGEA